MIANPRMQRLITKADPTFIKVKEGVYYYEHPFYGDESPLIVFKEGVWYESDDWE